MSDAKRAIAEMDKMIDMGSMDASDFLTRPRVLRWRNTLAVSQAHLSQVLREVEALRTALRRVTCDAEEEKS